MKEILQVHIPKCLVGMNKNRSLGKFGIWG